MDLQLSVFLVNRNRCSEKINTNRILLDFKRAQAENLSLETTPSTPRLDSIDSGAVFNSYLCRFGEPFF